MQQKVNYILHLNKAFQKLYQDNRLSPFHISLYYSLFQYWNISKFKSPLSISRDDQMQASKIGSVNTYLKCLKELDAWGYIKYIPSYNPMKGSLVHLFTFDNSTDTTKDITNNITLHTTSDNGTNNSNNTGGKTTLKKVVIPYTNSLNKLNKLKTKANGHEKKSASSDEDFNLSNTKSSGKNRKSDGRQNTQGNQKKEAGAGAKKKQDAEERFKRPLLQLVTKYFEKQKWPTIEAQKFFNHYESVGWLVGGKIPMQNWQASAANWMIKSGDFKIQSENKPGNLQVKQNKNYAEPL